MKSRFHFVATLMSPRWRLNLKHAGALLDIRKQPAFQKGQSAQPLRHIGGNFYVVLVKWYVLIVLLAFLLST